MIKMGTNYIKKSEISQLVMKKFEDSEFPVPQGWDACLRRQYGEYRKLPPIDQQMGHYDILPDPFNPCEHTEILNWKDRMQSMMKSKAS